MTLIAIVFFIAEFVLTCHSLREKYVWGFMFWLDFSCIVTLFMILPAVASAYSSLFGVGLSRSARIARTVSRAIRTLRSI